ncbi:MAG TPA: hypothetical protein PLR99_32050, partial [Polyangiaceae bacterium]|nr:hypothetical protein [Polyangiaceae bacterium]
MITTPASAPSSFFPRLSSQADPASGPEFALGVPGFSYADLHVPARLAELHATFWAWFRAEAPEAASTFTAYADAVASGAAVKPEVASTAVLVAAPYVSRFVGRLFAVEAPLDALRESTEERGVLWRFKAAFAKKRVLKDSAGKAWTGTPAQATAVARVALACAEVGAEALADEELRVASAVVELVDLDETARKSAKAGGAVWTPALAERAAATDSTVLITG